MNSLQDQEMDQDAKDIIKLVEKRLSTTAEIKKLCEESTIINEKYMKKIMQLLRENRK